MDSSDSKWYETMISEHTKNVAQKVFYHGKYIEFFCYFGPYSK